MIAEISQYIAESVLPMSLMNPFLRSKVSKAEKFQDNSGECGHHCSDNSLTRRTIVVIRQFG